MPGYKQARKTVQRGPKIITVTLLRRAGVQCHSHSKLRNAFPLLCEQSALGFDGCGERLVCCVKRGVERIADCFEDVTAMGFYRAA